LIFKYKSMLERYNKMVNVYNSLGGVRQLSIIEIGGGINLEPRNFKIKTPPSSARLQGFKSLLNKVSTEWRSINGSGKWIRNGTGGAISENINRRAAMAWMLLKEEPSGSSIYKHMQVDKEHQYWSASDSQTGYWRDCRKLDRLSYQERSYDASAKRLQIARFTSGRLDNSIIGQVENPTRIVFRQSPRRDILKPQEPPIWFPK
jgi:hypothetical protein